ncbi:HD domain-containing phosphohydrolase [Thermodesulfobacteriota bacterium]
MVKFSDLDKSKLNQKLETEGQDKKGSREQSRLSFREFDLDKSKLNQKLATEGQDKKDYRVQSRLSFRQLDKETPQITSEKITQTQKVNEEARKALYEEASIYLKQVFDTVRKRRTFVLEPGIQIIQKISEVQSSTDPLLIKALYLDEPFGYLINHCVNVSIFSIKMATNLGFSKDEQFEIGMAALVHEVGMGIIPENLIYKEQKLSAQEFEIFKKRPEYAYKILQFFGDDYAYLAATASQVHERIDGSGYPMGLHGDEILEYAQIIGLVDIYEALSHSRPQRERFLHFSAVKEIIKTGKKSFQKKYLKALLNTFSIFSLYSFVKLNSNAIGKVIETYPDQPMRPKLEIAFDSQGRRVLTKQVVDLSENSILFIVDSVSGKEIENLSLGTRVRRSGQSVELAQDDFASLDEPDVTEAGSDEFPLAGINEVAETDRNAFFIQKEEEIGSEKELVPEKPTRAHRTDKRRKPKRFRFVMLVAAIAVLVGAVVWQSGLIDFMPGKQGSLKQDVITTKMLDKKVSKKLPVETPEKVRRHPEVTTVKNKDAQQAPVAPGQPKRTRPAPALESSPDNKILAQGQKPTPAVSKETVPAAIDSKPSYPYSIKIPSFRTRKQAQQSLPEYTAKGLSAYWVKVDLGSKGTWYRVFAGYYETVQQAEDIIKELNLKEATVKKTTYAVLINIYSSQAALNERLQLLSQRGYSSYVIKGKANKFYLYVGAFYTHKGAAEQYAALLSDGIQSRIVER